MIDVTALGEILIDFTSCGKSAAGQKLFEQNPGGAPANVLACLSKCGKQTAFIRKVGQDMPYLGIGKQAIVVRPNSPLTSCKN